MSSYTEHTITDRATLLNDIEAIRKRGFSVDDEEKNKGMRCIAAPVFDANSEVVAGISVSGPTSRVNEGDIERLSLPVMNAAHELTVAIGGAVRHRAILP